MSFKKHGEWSCCGNCGRARPIGSTKAEQTLAEEVRAFKLKNESIKVSSYTSCQRSNCNTCKLCKHFNRYLYRECVNSHKAVASD